MTTKYVVEDGESHIYGENTRVIRGEDGTALLFCHKDRAPAILAALKMHAIRPEVTAGHLREMGNRWQSGVWLRHYFHAEANRLEGIPFPGQYRPEPGCSCDQCKSWAN